MNYVPLHDSRASQVPAARSQPVGHAASAAVPVASSVPGQPTEGEVTGMQCDNPTPVMPPRQGLIARKVMQEGNNGVASMTNNAYPDGKEASARAAAGVPPVQGATAMDVDALPANAPARPMAAAMHARANSAMNQLSQQSVPARFPLLSGQPM